MEKDVGDPCGLAHVHKDEEHAHDDGGDRQPLTQDDHPTEVFIAVQVVR